MWIHCGSVETFLPFFFPTWTKYWNSTATFNQQQIWEGGLVPKLRTATDLLHPHIQSKVQCHIMVKNLFHAVRESEQWANFKQRPKQQSTDNSALNSCSNLLSYVRFIIISGYIAHPTDRQNKNYSLSGLWPHCDRARENLLHYVMIMCSPNMCLYTP